MMRHFILSATALLTAAAAVAVPHGRWLETEHDFGAFNEELGTVYCEFRIVNDGDEPMAIVGARANCGCTKPTFSNAPIAPGDTGVIKVGYDATGRPGRFVKRVSVDLNADPMRSNLNITGTVIGTSNTLKGRFPVDVGTMKLREATIAYGDVVKGRTTGKYIEGYNASAETMHPVVEGVPPYINILVQPADVPPGEQFVVSTVFHSDRVKDWGIVTDSFSIRPSADSAHSQEIETIAIIKEDFSQLTPEQLAKAPVIAIDPLSIDLGRITRDSAPMTRTFTIANKGKEPLVIRSIKTPEKAVSVKLKNDRIKAGKSVTVTVTVNPSEIGDTELLNARITIISNDPSNPSRIVRVVGEVK